MPDAIDSETDGGGVEGVVEAEAARRELSTSKDWGGVGEDDGKRESPREDLVARREVGVGPCGILDRIRD